ISTIDVDSAYAYKEKGLVRTLGGIGKSIISFNLNELKERINVLIGKQKDPYDTFNYLQYISEKYKLNSIYFFLLADYGLNDKNVPFQSTLLQKQIHSISDYAEVGIHPSYGSNSNKQKLQIEHQRLEKILNRHITKSRQHFLKLSLPCTYRNLIELNITDDYTMGYASMPGFRASIANAFNFYDLDSETETKLRIHPFMIMEGTFKYYLNQSPEDFLMNAKKLIDETKKVNGEFISLWHNDSLSDTGIWSGWRKAYEEMIKYAVK
ncbi:MAG: polysaccharide deacetylase family protein, partial [Bacteroidia bacterium]